MNLRWEFIKKKKIKIKDTLLNKKSKIQEIRKGTCFEQRKKVRFKKKKETRFRLRKKNF